MKNVADGLESCAFHPNGRMAVVTCLGRDVAGAVGPAYSKLAVIDLKAKPMRLLSQIQIEAFPEGIEITPDGRKLFVGCTFANHIAVFEVDGFRWNRSPFVLQTGHGHASMALRVMSLK